MNTWKIYYNPSCSKCRKTLSILVEKKIDFKIIEYLKSPPSEEEILRLIETLGVAPQELVRLAETSSASTRIKLDKSKLVAQYLGKNPQLLQRPIVTNGNKGVIARPPEKVLRLLENT